MEFIVAVFFLCIIVAVIRGYFQSANEGASVGGRASTASRSVPGKLFVNLRAETFSTKGSADSLQILRVMISGSLRVPIGDRSVKFVGRLFDETDGESNSMPVVCAIPELADDDGLFSFEQEVDLPYADCSFTDLDLVRIPTFALAGPHSGRRRLRLAILVLSQRNSDVPYGAGTAVTSVELVLPGYKELAQRATRRDQQVAQLALLLAAADGRIDTVETARVKRFFAARHAALDQAERHQKVENLVAEAMKPFRDGSLGSAKLKEQLGDICAQLVDDGDESVKQMAYELAVQVVAADEEVDEREHQALGFVATRLDLPSGFVKEVHDRNLRANMFNGNASEMLLGIPPGLSVAEKRDFLSVEYRKWRSRVTHQDPKVASEASVRLQQIAKARAALGDA